jgi:glycosyltransferase involved in cell wall biosynthesis
MKILHVETGRHLYGGPQQVIYLARALRDLGHDNLIVCPPGSGIDNAARAAAIPVRNLFCAGDLDLPFAYRLAQFIGQTRPDIVHCHSRRGADVLGGLAASFADVPAVVSRRVDNTEMRLVAALRYRPFRKVIAISEAIARELRDRGVDEQRLAVIRSAVDVDRFEQCADCTEFRREYAVPDAALLIAAAGQLIPRKGHRYLLQAAAELRAERAEFRMLIFGDGYLRNQLQAQAESLGVADIVTLAGFREDLDDYVGCFDIFVHPALAEGLGVAALKAAAAGVPVIGFEAGGLAEAVVHGETGILVPPEDTAALRTAIATLMDDETLRTRLGGAGRKRMREDFSIATMVQKHVALYESVIDA